MLLVALLVAAPASATAPFYGEICAAAERASAASPERPEGENAPVPAKSHLDPCPICSAFAHHGVSALPAAVALPGTDSGRPGWSRHEGEDLRPLGERLGAPPRAPPSRA